MVTIRVRPLTRTAHAELVTMPKPAAATVDLVSEPSTPRDEVEMAPTSPLDVDGDVHTANGEDGVKAEPMTTTDDKTKGKKKRGPTKAGKGEIRSGHVQSRSRLQTQHDNVPPNAKERRRSRSQWYTTTVNRRTTMQMLTMRRSGTEKTTGTRRNRRRRRLLPTTNKTMSRMITRGGSGI